MRISQLHSIQSAFPCLLITALTASSSMAQSPVNVSSVAELQSAMGKSGQHIVMKPGKYAMGSQKFTVSGSNNIFVLTGAHFTWTVGEAGAGRMTIPGSGNTIRGGEFEDVYFDGTKEITDFSAYNADRERFANGGGNNIGITGSGNRLVSFKMTVRGSFPYGYGSMFGIGSPTSYGTAKHCGIQIKAKNTELDSVEVQQASFCHAIFMQTPADNTLIKNSLVEGRVRLGADMYKETAGGIAHRSGYMMHFDAAGAQLGSPQPIPKDQMFTLSEDGIRIYSGGGRARVENTTVKKTRGGIRLYQGSGGQVINSTAIDCGSTNFNLPGGGTITGSSGNFAYAPLLDFRTGPPNQTIEMTILPSPHATGSHNIANIQGGDHKIVFHRAPGPLDTTTRAIVVTGSGSNIRNETEYRIILESGAGNNTIASAGPVTDRGSGNKVSKIDLVMNPVAINPVAGRPLLSPKKMVILDNSAVPGNARLFDLQGRPGRGPRESSAGGVRNIRPGVYFVKP